MYNLFNDYIAKYDNDNVELEQIWNEEDYEPCVKMLNDFTDDEWKLLIDSLPTRSIIFKKRLACCLNNPKNTYQLEIISHFIKIDDVDLFMTTLFNINNYNFIFPQEMKYELLKRMDYFRPKVSIFKKMVFDMITNKLNDEPYDISEELGKYKKNSR